MPERGVLFIDGNNWYHSVKELGGLQLGKLDYAKISEKLLGPRTWIGTRYYIGRVPQTGDRSLYAAQRSFLASLKATDPRISTHLGRLESRPARDQTAKNLLRYVGNLRIRIDPQVRADLLSIAKHGQATVLVEKAVDVMLAVDMIVMAQRDEFDAAYLLSSDGDFTSALSAARGCGKKVYAVSASAGAQLAKVAHSFIRLRRDWFLDCY
jgi:uncharacterized LabA/DUF88 family protein